jgi:fructokinase
VTYIGPAVVVGEALYDVVLDASGGMTPHAGGGPFNTARTIGRLGQPVSFLGRISTDVLGSLLAEQLAEDGVWVDRRLDTDEPTTVAIAELDDDGSAGYRFYVDGTSAPGLTRAAALEALPAEAGYLHVGTLGLVLEPLASTVEAVVEQVSEQTVVMLDPNCRPRLIRDRRPYLERLRRVLRRTDVVKLSEEDLDWLDPGRPRIDAVRALLTHGPRLAVLTRGSLGAVVITPEVEVDIPARPVVVIDTIGAGDAFGGALLAWWQARGFGREHLTDLDASVEAVRFACMVAAHTCARPGARPPFLAELAE